MNKEYRFKHKNLSQKNINSGKAVNDYYRNVINPLSFDKYFLDELLNVL